MNTLPKVNGSPLKSYQNPISEAGSSSFATIFSGVISQKKLLGV